MSSYDLIVVGGGPGGYVAAIRASQLGLKTLCVEREKLGGICLNWGCIPTKALLRSAEVLELCHRAEEFGVKIQGEVSFDFAAMMARSRKVVDVQEKGIKSLFKKYKVEHLEGTARLGGAGKVLVDGKELTAKHILLATGARARPLPGADFDGEKIIDYRATLALKTQPKRMVIIGAGAIGVEFASFFNSLGSEVTVVEFLPQLVPIEDEEVSKHLLSTFKKRKITCALGHKVTSIEKTPSGVRVTTEDRNDPSKKPVFEGDVALVAIGIQANVENLGLEAIGVKIERGFVAIDDVTYATSVKGVYAIGDMTGPPALAHTASAEGIACVERLGGLNPPPIDYDSIPAGTFCHPEIGSIGMTEAKAKEAGRPMKIGRFPFRALGKARAAGEMDGFVKVIWDGEDGRLLGAHIIGPGASDLIAEYGLAKTTEVNGASLLHTVHAHPTLAEALREATEDAYGHAIHI
jgi:dihydrolipoamide dehydrogenase